MKKSTITFILILLSSCRALPEVAVEQVQPVETVEVKTQIDNYLQSQPSPVQPLAISIINDVTGSAPEHRIQPVTLDQLKPIFDHLKQHGGEVAFISICDDSNRPALRITLDEPPRQLSASDLINPQPPVSPDKKGNPLKMTELVREYEAKIPNYQKDLNQDLQTVEQHKEQIQKGQTESEQKLKQSEEQIKLLLSQTPNCQNTDIWGAVTRTNLFLNEDRSNWTHRPQRYAVFITDGLHNTSHQPVQIESKTEILLVNGSGSVGVFQNLDYKSFESAPAAFRYLIESSNKEVVIHE